MCMCIKFNLRKTSESLTCLKDLYMRLDILTIILGHRLKSAPASDGLLNKEYAFEVCFKLIYCTRFAKIFCKN